MPPRRKSSHVQLALLGCNHTLIPQMDCIGIDEAGRGCLAGPVVAGAVFMAAGFDTRSLPGLNDSKKLSAVARVRLSNAIRSSSIAWSVGFAWPPEIDRVNILNATFLAMSRAAKVLHDKAQANMPDFFGNSPSPSLACKPEPENAPWPLLYIDGPWPIRDAAWNTVLGGMPPRQIPVIGGDAKIPAISAASIMAKTVRDHVMIVFDRRFPGYGFAKHKGYGTAEHLLALKRLGPCPMHRLTFAGAGSNAPMTGQGSLLP